MDWDRFEIETETGRLAMLREHLSQSSDELFSPEKQKPFWLLFMEMASWACLEEISHEDMARQHLDWFDDQGRGWLIWSLITKTPDHLILNHLPHLPRKSFRGEGLNGWIKHMPSVAIVQRIMMRLWQEGERGFPFDEAIAQAKQRNRMDLTRVWQFWQKNYPA